MKHPLRFHYRDFWDRPRAILCELDGTCLYLLCPYLEDRDDFSTVYRVYQMHEELKGLAARVSWIGMESEGQHLGDIEIRQLALDSSRRRFLEEGELRRLFGKTRRDDPGNEVV